MKRSLFILIPVLIAIASVFLSHHSFQARSCPPGMVSIRGGDYLIGVDSWWRPWAVKRARVAVGAFCIDRYEYPNQKGAVPRVNISYSDSAALCREAGKRLCKSEEWFTACQGRTGRYYSYGNEKDYKRCNTDGQLLRGEQTIMPAGRFPECKSPEGVFDLDGNVSEWVEETNEQGDHFLLGGTAWYSGWYGQDCTSRHNHDRDFNGMHDDGFRCCKDP